MILELLFQLSAREIETAERTVYAVLAEAGEDTSPYPEIIIRSRQDWPFSLPVTGQRLAMAVRNTEGQEFILLNIDAPPKDIDQIIRHEMAHILAWREHGESIREHGREFLKICRRIVSRRPAHFCKGDP